jgi:dCTP deaminase
MYLTDRDIKWAIENGDLIIDPAPKSIDPTSVDLHLNSITEAKIWDIHAFIAKKQNEGIATPELRIAKYNLKDFGKEYLVEPPEYSPDDSSQTVGRRGNEIIVKPGGFLLWTTIETVGTPATNADLICFVDGKSTRARAGIVVHLTAPTIHSSWVGNITLEIANLGPFHIILKEGDAIAQLTVARVTNPPDRTMAATSVTYKQRNVSGAK